MKSICGLQFLVYLGLRGSDIDRIPTTVRKLRALETLDIRDTNVQVLPIQVFQLQNIACIFGQFKLPVSFKKAKTSMEHLRCLAGVVVEDDWDGFDQIMRKAGMRIKKLKIWCKRPLPDGRTIFRDRFQAIIKSLDHITIESAYLCNEVIDLLTPDCSIRTIKLRGALYRLPEPAVLTELNTLLELHLVGSGLNCRVLSVLQKLSCLMYVKLSEPEGFEEGSIFVCKSGGFGSLQRLCFEAPRLPLVVIQPGSLPVLTFLDLFCPQYSEMVLPWPSEIPGAERGDQVAGVFGFLHLSKLEEVTLHRAALKRMVKKWNKASDRHKNRPRVKPQLT